MPRLDAPPYKYAPCNNCGERGHKHQKRRVYDDRGPAGSYYVEYWCPGTAPTQSEVDERVERERQERLENRREQSTEGDDSPAIMTDGGIDADKNGSTASRNRIDEDECAEIRRRLAAGMAPSHLADEIGRGPDSISRHGYGNCTHSIEVDSVEPDSVGPLPSRSVDSTSMAQLYERPRTAAEMETTTPPLTSPGVARLPLPRQHEHGGGSKGRGTLRTVYFLYGDERRAVREFIRSNEDYVEGCMEDPSNPLQYNWEEFLWDLLCEEWQLYQYHGDHGGDDQDDVAVTDGGRPIDPDADGRGSGLPEGTKAAFVAATATAAVAAIVAAWYGHAGRAVEFVYLTIALALVAGFVEARSR